MEINFLRLDKLPIFQQLQIEEALLRTNDENWCIVNSGSAPAIVMGISANPSLVINHPLFLEKPLPVIRRFSGGGTVYIDEQTLFVTFILNGISFPDKMLEWSRDFYRPVFTDLPFFLKENDYALGEKKVGGNAQYFRKNRYLHHTSFLFDFKEENMSYLLYPPKTPVYREGRSHSDFLTKLSLHFPSQEAIVNKIEHELSKRYVMKLNALPRIESFLSLPHRKTTALVKICREVHDAHHECYLSF
ncbi:putative lipoate-protein ligase A [Chlamydiales bacterium STE3]|nr:putative lipoate-protein ligase A [Chlamydiales bacterium STE3]